MYVKTRLTRTLSGKFLIRRWTNVQTQEILVLYILYPLIWEDPPTWYTGNFHARPWGYTRTEGALQRDGTSMIDGLRNCFCGFISSFSRTADHLSKKLGKNEPQTPGDPSAESDLQWRQDRSDWYRHLPYLCLILNPDTFSTTMPVTKHLEPLYCKNYQKSSLIQFHFG